MGDLFLENNFDQYIDELDSVIFPAQSYALHEQVTLLLLSTTY